MKFTVTFNELQARIASNQSQAKQAELLAMWRHAQIVSGGYKLRGTQRGREPTEEERAEGKVIGFRDLTDEEKLEDTLATMARHIDWCRKFSDAAASMMKAKKIIIDSQEMFEFEVND